MNLQMTEEDARKMISFINNSDMKESIIKNWINEGYIARPIWEEAEEKFQAWRKIPMENTIEKELIVIRDLTFVLHDALTAAVERIKELKNEN